MAEQFEIIIFTAAEQMYADEILNRLQEQIDVLAGDDRAPTISHRLYRQHTVQVKSGSSPDGGPGQTKCFIKDLKVLKDRDLARTIIVDNIGENFSR